MGVGPWADGVIGGLTGSVRSRLFIFWSVGISSCVWFVGVSSWADGVLGGLIGESRPLSSDRKAKDFVHLCLFRGLGCDV